MVFDETTWWLVRSMSWKKPVTTYHNKRTGNNKSERGIANRKPRCIVLVNTSVSINCLYSVFSKLNFINMFLPFGSHPYSLCIFTASGAVPFDTAMVKNMWSRNRMVTVCHIPEKEEWPLFVPIWWTALSFFPLWIVLFSWVDADMLSQDTKINYIIGHGKEIHGWKFYFSNHYKSPQLV